MEPGHLVHSPERPAHQHLLDKGRLDIKDVSDQRPQAAGVSRYWSLLVVTFSQWVQCVDHQLEDGVPQGGVVERR